MTAAPTSRPVPVPDAASAGYWDAAAHGHLALPRCARCRQFCLPPVPVCPTCGSTDPAYTSEVVAGTGTVRSWTVVRDAFLPGFAQEVPYLLVDVELDCQPGLRTIGRLLDGPGAHLRQGDAVVVAFEALGDGTAVPAFRLEHP